MWGSACSSNFEIANQTLPYGSTVQIGPSQIAGGTVTFIARDAGNPTITATAVGNPPPTCSGGIALPDLVAQNLTPSSTNVTVGYNFGVQFTAANLGAPLTPSQLPVSARLVLSVDNNVSSDNVEVGLPIGTALGITGISGYLPTDMPSGQYYALVEVDFNDEVAESNEANNVSAVQGLITVNGIIPPDDECGFDKTHGTYPNFLNLFYSNNRNNADGGFSVGLFGNTGGANNPHLYRELTLDATGNLLSQINETTFPPTNTVLHERTLDGNYVTASGSSPTSVSFTKYLPSGANIWTKTLAFSPAQSNTEAPGIHAIGSFADGYLLVGTYEVSGQQPARIPFLIKTDINGVKQWQSYLPQENDFFLIQSVQQEPSGRYYLTLFSSNLIRLMRVSSSGSHEWTKSVLSDLPSSDLISISESSDGSGVFVSRYDNLQSYTRKLASSDGSTVWDKNYVSVFPANGGSFYNAAVLGAVSTVDGGVVTGFSVFGGAVQNPVFGYGKMDGSGNMVWFKTLGSEYRLGAVLQTSDGGYLFSGTKNNTEWAVLKTTSTGDLLPTCDGGSNSGIDLELDMDASTLTPSIWTNFTVNVTVTNTGDETATGVKVAFPKADGLVYTGGIEWEATTSSFNPFGNQKWTVGSLPPGASETLTVSYFLLTSNSLQLAAEVSDMDGQDVDSTPGNAATHGPPPEDDEAFITINSSSNTPLVSQGIKGRAVQLRSIFPNPVYYGEVNAEIWSEEEGKHQLEIYDLFGRKAQLETVDLRKGRNEIRLNVSNLESGTYYLNMVGQNWRNMPVRFVVARW